MLKWFLLVLLGRLTIYLIQEFPLPSFLQKFQSATIWHGCILCIGTWVYTFLSALFMVDLLSLWFGEVGLVYVPVISEILTGAITSWLMYVFEAGYKELYLNITII